MSWGRPLRKRSDWRSARPQAHADLLDAETLQFVERLVREFGPSRSRVAPSQGGAATRVRRGQVSRLRSCHGPHPPGRLVGGAIPDDLQNRRVEITGPTDRKMIINALNSARTSTWPTSRTRLRRRGIICSTVNRTSAMPSRAPSILRVPREAVSTSRQDGHADGAAARAALAGEARVAGRQAGAGVTVRFRRVLLPQRTQTVGQGQRPVLLSAETGEPSGGAAVERGLPAGARRVGIPRGSIRATVLIETLPAAFEMDEILYQLREHSAGLNCGRWDYIFSIIKKFCKHPEFTMPGSGRSR